MPTELRRIVLSLPPEVEAAISDLADAHGRPLATVTVNLLAEMAPQIHLLAQIQRHVKADNAQAAQKAAAQMFGDAMTGLFEAPQKTAQKAHPLSKSRRK